MLKKTLFIVSLALSSGNAYSAADTWWVYHSDSKKCKPAPTGELHPKEIQKIVKDNGGKIVVLSDNDAKGLFVFQMQMPNENLNLMSMAKTFSGCELLGEIARKSGIK